MGGVLAVSVVIRVALSIVMLGYVSYKDVKTREVKDLVWIVFGAVALCLDAVEVYTGALGLYPLLAAVGFSVLFAALTGYVGFFGGADLLAFVVMGLLNPVAPSTGFEPLMFTPIFFPLTVISNSVMIGASGAIFVLVYNVSTSKGGDLFSGYVGLSSWGRMLLLLTGIRKDVEKVRGPPFEYPLEAIGEDGNVSLVIRPNLTDDTGASTTFSRIRSMGRRRVWVSYSLPFLLILGVGYVSSILLGDFALYIVSFFFR